MTEIQKIRSAINQQIGQPRKEGLPRVNHEEIENPNRSITSRDWKRVIKNFPQNKSPGPAGVIGGNSIKHSKKT